MRGYGRFFASCRVFFTTGFRVTQLPSHQEAISGNAQAGMVVEGDASTGKWQELTPVLSSSCTVFPRSGFLTQAQQGDYAWALWRPYACCERRGQVFLGSVDFY